MIDIEKVIKWLDVCKTSDEAVGINEDYPCRECPYKGSTRCIRELIADALALLKQKKQTWIPFKFRPMTDEEVEYYDEYYGAGEFEHIMVENTPDDGQEILVSWNDFVWLDTYCADHDGVGLEGHGEIEEGMAWMPLPEPYVAGDQK